MEMDGYGQNGQHITGQNDQNATGQNDQNVGGNSAQENKNQQENPFVEFASKKKGMEKSNGYDQEEQQTKGSLQ